MGLSYEYRSLSQAKREAARKALLAERGASLQFPRAVYCHDEHIHSHFLFRGERSRDAVELRLCFTGTDECNGAISLTTRRFMASASKTNPPTLQGIATPLVGLATTSGGHGEHIRGVFPE